MANLNFAQPDDNPDLDYVPNQEDYIPAPDVELPDQIVEPSEGEDPGADELAYLESLKGKPSLLEKIGLIPKEKFDRVAKAANDNRTALRTFGERTTSEMRDLRAKIELLQPSRQQQSPKSEELYAQYEESGKFEDLRAARAAERAEMESSFEAKMEGRLAKARAEIEQQTYGAQSEREWLAELAKAEHKDVDREEVETFFDRQENLRARPEEIIFSYRARKYLAANPGKNFMDFVATYGTAVARAGRGAPLPPPGEGSRRPNPQTTGRRLSKQELIADYDSKG